MKYRLRTFLSATLAFACIAVADRAHGQFYKLHGADVGVAATGQFTTSITSQRTGSTGQLLPHQATTTSPGALVTLREHPVSWAGIELNYQYIKMSERYFSAYNNAALAYVPTDVHEATAAYLFHVKMHKLQPYLAVGGGALDFRPANGVSNRSPQWRATGLVDVGLDMQTHSRLGFRIGARDLIYRAPNFNSAALASSRWVSTEEPYGGVYVKF
jgi:hypothetical protein